MILKRLSVVFFALITIVAFSWTTIYVEPLSAKDDEEEIYSVLLVHGLASSSDSWDQLPAILDSKGYNNIYVLDFNEWRNASFNKESNDANPLERAAAVIARQLSVIRKEFGAEKVDIIAHSIGGLAVRAYLAGWGEEAEKRGKYSNDVRKVAYINTPFFGYKLDKLDEDELESLLEETDWSEFMQTDYFLKALFGVSSTLLDIHDDFKKSSAASTVEELTIMTGGDKIMTPMSANLNGVRKNRLKDSDGNYVTTHLNWSNYQHADSDIIGNNNKNAIEVRNEDHPIVKLAIPFLSGEDYQDLGKNIAGDNKATIYIVLMKNDVIDRDEITEKNIRVWFEKAGRDERLKDDVYWHEDDHILQFDAKRDGVYYFFTTDEDDNRVKISITIEKGTSQVIYLDPDDIPSGDMPAKIHNLDTLKAAAKAIVGSDELLTTTNTDGLKQISKKIRDAIVAYYPQEWMLSLPDEPNNRLNLILNKETDEQWEFFSNWDKGSRTPWDHLIWKSLSTGGGEPGSGTNPGSSSGAWPAQLVPGNNEQLKNAAIAALGFQKLNVVVTDAERLALSKEIVQAISRHYNYFRPDYPWFPGARLDILIYKRPDGVLERWDMLAIRPGLPKTIDALIWKKHPIQTGIQAW